MFFGAVEGVDGCVATGADTVPREANPFGSLRYFNATWNCK